MAIEMINRSLLRCDGCGSRFGVPNGFVSPADARGEAYGEGWRFPHQIGKTGKTLSSTSDVCPACIDGWAPQGRASRRDSLTAPQLAALQDEAGPTS